MTALDFEEIEVGIQTFGWYPFGNKKFKCPGVGSKEKEFYVQNNELPPPCDRCYKALIFWEGSYCKENLNRFFDTIKSFNFEYRGKFDKRVVVFYFRDKRKMLSFLEYLKNKMQEYGVRGKVEWRRACKEYQDLKPALWKNAKEFIPDTLDKQAKLTHF